MENFQGAYASRTDISDISIFCLELVHLGQNTSFMLIEQKSI